MLLSLLSLRADETNRIRVIVERQDAASDWHEVNSTILFGAGDRLRFRVSANVGGHLYVMNHGTSGTDELLFPRSKDESLIEPAKEYVVPASQGWFRVTGPPGEDVMYWLVSPSELSLPADKPLPQMRPRCDDSIVKPCGGVVYELHLAHM